MLTWCLFVANSRQTTSSVPWHRASKYDRKQNLHLTLKRFLFKWSLILCMCRKRFVLHLLELQSGFRRGSGRKKNAQLCTDNMHCWNSFRPISCGAVSVMLLAWHVWLETNSSHVYCTSLRLQTARSTRWPNRSVFLWSDFNFNSMNQTSTFFPLLLFLLKYLDSSCQSTHVAPIRNPLLKTWLIFGHNCMWQG